MPELQTMSEASTIEDLRSAPGNPPPLPSFFQVRVKNASLGGYSGGTEPQPSVDYCD